MVPSRINLENSVYVTFQRFPDCFKAAPFLANVAQREEYDARTPTSPPMKRLKLRHADLLQVTAITRL